MTRTKKLTLLMIFAIIFTLTCALPSVAKGKKKKRKIKTGHLVFDQTWSGNIHVIGDVIVPEGITLRIKPGTKIYFSRDGSDFDLDIPLSGHVKNNRANIIVKGVLVAIGKKNKKIRFGAVKDKKNKPAKWGGIVFLSESSSTIKNCRIGNAVFGVAYLNGNDSQVDKSIVENCDIGIYNADSSRAYISSTVVRNCGTGIESLGRASPTIEYNYIAKNEWGISYSEESTPKINNNTIINNELGLSCYGDNRVEIINNKIEGNYLGVKAFTSKAVFKKNKITKNKIGLEYEPSAAPKLIKNVIRKNKMNLKEK